ncbi:uncharacterized protein LOC110931438 [Helianthus annuus]|uniref:uncharacterized protein LOC110931438 n=1 Tax=Helianthus annuus TaxID=4232 RepID=UPI000B9096D2|nr:uncharacterized protein LOC110931438 [Helianthus annuus]
MAVREVIKQNRVCLAAIQETKLGNSPEFQVRSIWGRRPVEFDWVVADGRSGGLLTMWNPGFFKRISSVKHRNFLVVSGLVAQRLGAKRELWSIISDTMESLNGWWVIMGDFNAVRNSNERLNTEFSQSCADAFNFFIQDNGLFDNFWNKWPDASVTALPWVTSDHCPVILSTGAQNFGAIPFRFYNSWLCKPEIDSVVVNAISNHPGVGPADVVLAGKL